MSKKKKTNPALSESDASEEMGFQVVSGLPEASNDAGPAAENPSARLEEIGFREMPVDDEDALEFAAEEGYGDSAIPFAEDDAAPAWRGEPDAPAPLQSGAEIESIDFGEGFENGLEAEASEVEDETAFVEGIGEDETLKSPADIKAALECLFFTTSHPLTLQKVRTILGKIDQKTLRGIVLQVQAEYEARGSGLQIMESAEGFQMCTRPKYADVILRLHRQRKKNPLSLIGLETLAIIAYKQPITRAEIEMIRGVESSGILRNLSDMGLIRVVGRKEVIGRPQLYGTTNVFLNTFGLKSIEDLPPINELRRRYSDGSLFPHGSSAQSDEEPNPAIERSTEDASSEADGEDQPVFAPAPEPMSSGDMDASGAPPVETEAEPVSSGDSPGDSGIPLAEKETETSRQAAAEDDLGKA